MMYIVNGNVYTELKDLVEHESNLNYTTVINRINRGNMTIEEAISKPLRKNKRDDIEILFNGIEYINLKECYEDNMDKITVS